MQSTPDAGGEAANDITLSDVFVLPSPSSRALHFTNTSTGNVIKGLYIQSPSGTVEAIKFDGAGVKWNKIYGVMSYDGIVAAGAPAFVLFDGAEENEIDNFFGGMTGVPVFRFQNAARRNTIFGGAKEGTPSSSYSTDASSTGNSIYGWTSTNTMMEPGSGASVLYTTTGMAVIPSVSGNLKPLSDSTSAIQLQTSAGTSVLNVDTPLTSA